jgi:hypothetical protein
MTTKVTKDNIDTTTLTTVGTLTALTVNGEVDLGAVGNITITGGSANYVLTTDGTGNLSWAASSGGADPSLLLSPFLLMGA